MFLIVNLFIFFLLIINNVLSYKIINKLSIQQWTKIREIMKHPSCTPPMRERLNLILFNRYEGWAGYHATLFKKKHTILCKKIKNNELRLFALNGLNKAIIKYNPEYIFHNHAETYIYSSLYAEVSKQQTMNMIPTTIRKNKNHPWRLKNERLYRNMVNTIFIGDDDFKLNKFVDDKNNPSRISDYNNSLIELWNLIQQKMNFFSFKVFKYKYNIEFNNVMSNKKIADLMGCSEETIRKNLRDTSELLKLSFKN